MSFEEYLKHREDYWRQGDNLDEWRKSVLKDKYESRQRKLKKVRNAVLAILLSSGIISSAYAATRMIDSPSSNTQTEESITPENSEPTFIPEEYEDKDTYISSWTNEYGQKEDYVFCHPEYVYNIAKQSLKDFESTLTSIDGVTNMGGDSFYQDFFNADFISTIAYTESTFRVKKANGSSLISHDGAIGMCQLLPIAVNTINDWATNTMEMPNINYSTADLNDPVKSIELCILTNIRNCKNDLQLRDDVFSKLGIPYTDENVEKMLYAMYFYGEGNFRKAVDNETLMDTYLNPNWEDDSGNNYVYKCLENKQMLISNRQQSNEFTN